MCIQERQRSGPLWPEGPGFGGVKGGGGGGGGGVTGGGVKVEEVEDDAHPLL